MIMPAVTSWYPQYQKSFSSRLAFSRSYLLVPDVAEQAAISMGVPVQPVECGIGISSSCQRQGVEWQVTYLG